MNILLTGNSFHGYDTDVRDALLELGHSVDFLPHNIHGPFNTKADFSKKLKFGILPAKFKFNAFVNQSIAHYNRLLLQLVNKNKYDLVLLIGAKTVTEVTLSAVKSPKVLWFMDGINYYPAVQPKLAHFDHVFFFEPTDTVAQASTLNDKCSTLHLGFNPKRFFPSNMARKFDFSFVGSYYPNRDELLHSVVDKTKNALIIGDFQRSAYESVRAINHTQQIPIEQVNQLYNSSKININIHHKQSIEGLNVRTFEVQGSGNIQLVENQLAAQEFFTDGENILLYSSPEEFKDKLLFYLDRSDLQLKLRTNAYTDALVHHTWKQRMITLMEELTNRGIV